MGKSPLLAVLTAILVLAQSLGFMLSHNLHLSVHNAADVSTCPRYSKSSQDDYNTSNVKNHLSGSTCRKDVSRREVYRHIIGTSAILSSGMTIGMKTVVAASVDDLGYIPAVRPTAYLVDSTIPPSLIPLNSATKEKKVLDEIGRGSGTDKEEIKTDTLNLNNFMNKAVFGSVDFVSELVGLTKDESKSGPGYASFVCMGVPSVAAAKDVDLAVSLLSSILQGRDTKKATALALSFCPMSVQPALDSYVKTESELELRVAMKQSGVADEIVDLYMPLIRYARNKSLEFLAISPEFVDIKEARNNGLASIDFERRQFYVADPQGFISVTKDPRYKLYTDRSLLKDFTPANAGDDVKNFYAERIFVHEAGATAIAKYAMERPESLVAVVAPIADLRYLQGINGRIPRIYSSLATKTDIESKVTDNAVTTILLNPTAADTLSAGRRLRLEIGTGPETLDYQTKVADYLWFSSSPKVNLIPRMMNG